MRTSSRWFPAVVAMALLMASWGSARAQPSEPGFDLEHLQEQLLRYRPVALDDPAAPQTALRCATTLLELARRHRDELSAEALGVLEEFESLSPAEGLRYLYGPFEIVYDTGGIHAVPTADEDLDGVPDYVQRVGLAMEESWYVEIGALGYIPPDLHGDRLEVWLLGLGAVYGCTVLAPAAPGGQRILLQADFPALFDRYDLPNDDPRGQVMGGIRVAAAHALKHVCQWNESHWSEIDHGTAGLLELDATWMEDVVCDEVNDYHNCLEALDSPYAHPENSLILASFGGSVWQHYMSERYGLDLVRSYWRRRGFYAHDETPQVSYVETIDSPVADWSLAWGEYLSWVYLSGSRAREGEGFEEAARYPTVPPRTEEFALPARGGAASDRRLQPLSGNFHRFVNSASYGGMPQVAFSGDPDAMWTLTVLLERAEEVIVRHPHVHYGPILWRGTGLDLGDYEAVTLIVGCRLVAETEAASREHAYELNLTVPGMAVGRLQFDPPYPNPFREETTLSFSVPLGGPTGIYLYDVRGRLVGKIGGADAVPGVRYEKVYRPRKPWGDDLAAGVYLLRLVSQAGEATRRLVYVR